MLGSAQAVFLLVLALVAPVLYLGVMRARNNRFHELATLLGATYKRGRWLQLGRVEGAWGGRKYVIGSNAKFTSVAVACVNEGIRFTATTDVFRPFPNWQQVHAVGTYRERVLLTRVTRRGVVALMPVEYHGKLQLLLQQVVPLVDAPGQSLPPGTIWALHHYLEFRCFGFISDAEQVRRVLRFLDMLAVRLKFMPIR